VNDLLVVDCGGTISMLADGGYDSGFLRKLIDGSWSGDVVYECIGPLDSADVGEAEWGASFALYEPQGLIASLFCMGRTP